MRMLKVGNVVVVDASLGEPGHVLQVSPEGIVVRCGEGALAIREVQKEGGRWMAVSEFLAGHRLVEGACLGRPR